MRFSIDTNIAHLPLAVRIGRVRICLYNYMIWGVNSNRFFTDINLGFLMITVEKP